MTADGWTRPNTLRVWQPLTDSRTKRKQVAFCLKQKCPKNVDEAVTATLEMETYLLPKGSRVAQVAEGYILIESLQSAESSMVVRLPAPPQEDQRESQELPGQRSGDQSDEGWHLKDCI